ncbi:MAG: transcriptional regulator [Cyanothece sp. SIO1E1]|nr:transcriptional regulator [Cyanothece sp. SIO1E1]
MPVKSYRDDLLIRLADPEYSSKYLKVALDEPLKDGNMEAFLLALKNIVEATQVMQEAADDDTDVSTQPLHRCLSGNGIPTIETLALVLNAVGLTIDFKPLSENVK